MVITPELESIVNQYGKRYKPALLPADIERGRVGNCFDTCVMICHRNRKYRYVEGFARDPLTGKWILHAWVTDGLHAFDPTWRATKNDTGEDTVIPTDYFGIRMPIKEVLGFMRITGNQGVLANRRMAMNEFFKIIRGY